ncbi:FCD domain-containing protein [Microbacterium allomyrinae]|uniref:FCD domain-containing protein n=1 Tax=Microbacterium allomyrinae TaxID=2830666 RepID=A0A9X1S4J5_9MICO|nr:FCD domain-containing protein [Microbacterium allomyrinae]MCC2033163.1 FCD domain-containing protein [Microbacterium allomyrinae]
MQDAPEDPISRDLEARVWNASMSSKDTSEEDLASLVHLLESAEDQSRLYNARVAEDLPIDGHPEQLYARVQEFNSAVLASTHNPVLIRIFEQTRALSSIERQERSLRRLREDPTFGRSRWDSHRSTLEAIRARDPDLAERTAIERARSAMDDLAGLGDD